MNRITLILFSLSVLLISSCSTNKVTIKTEEPKKYSATEYLESVQSNPQIKPGIGFGNLRLEETRSKHLFNENIDAKSYIANGVTLQFQTGDTLIGINIDNQIIYKTPDGKEIGLTEKEIIAELGEPESRGTKLNKGETQIGSLPSLNYEGMSIIFYEGSRVIQLFKEK